MKSKQQANEGPELSQSWLLPNAATLGSSVRARGIFLEVRARLPSASKKSLKVSGVELALRMPLDAEAEFRAAVQLVSKALQNIEQLPVIPREIEDILAISTTERHRWLKDGRLPSAGTRTVKLRGRAKKITFHVFEPRLVEELLDQDMVANWREDDAVTAAENRRRAAWKAKLRRSQKSSGDADPAPDSGLEEPSNPGLRGWAEFERDGPLR